MMAFCKWHNKRFNDVAEWKQGQCNEMGAYCTNCDMLVPNGEQERDEEEE